MSDYNDMKKMVNMTRKANEQKQRVYFKELLKSHIATKFKTTIIGSISKFEDLFGELWGMGLQPEELNAEQRYWREKWSLARTEILNNGNSQSRAASSEIDQYNVEYNKYEYNFNTQDKRDLLDE